MNIKTIISPLLTLGLLAGSIVFGSAKSTWEKDADKRKSDYYYMEALRQKSLDSIGSLFHIYDYAYSLDTTALSIGHELGYYYMVLAEGDNELASKGYLMMKRYFDSNPSDYYSSSFYGQINDRLNNSKESLRVWETLDSLYPDKIDVTLMLANSLASTGDSAEMRRSLGVLDRIERSTGKDLGISSQRIRTLFALNDTAAIFAETDSILRLLPRSVSARVYVGDVYEALGRLDNALECYNMACEMDSTSGQAYYRRALFYNTIGDSISYDREIERVMGMDDLDTEIKIEILKDYIRDIYDNENKRAQIDNLFGILIEEAPHDVSVRQLYSAFLWTNQDYDKASEQLEYIVDLNPADSRSWRSYAGVYFDKEDYPKAIEIAKKALTYHPGNYPLIELIGASYQVMEKYDDAIAVFEETYEKGDSLSVEERLSLARNLGDVYQRVDKKEKAIEWYEKALEINHNDELTLNNYAYFLACEDIDLDRAEKYARDAVYSAPTNTVYLDTYAWVLFKKKDYAKAKEYIDRALKHAQEDLSSEYFEHAGDIYFMNGNPDEALEFWEEGLKLDPNNELLKKKVKNKTYFFK